MRVLIVDDEQLVRWFLERALKKWGHEVASVSSVAEAMDEIGRESYDVMFTDLRMPGGNGAELVQRVREIPSKEIKIVVCSAFISQEMVERCATEGVLTLKKPFKLAELEQTLRLCQEG